MKTEGDIKMNNLTGKRFGRLIVLKLDTSRTNRKYWKCKCDCGSIVSVSESHLKSGHTKSCGCARKKWPEVLPGQRFNHLTVLDRCKTENMDANIGNRTDIEHVFDDSGMLVGGGKIRKIDILENIGNVSAIVDP